MESEDSCKGSSGHSLGLQVLASLGGKKKGGELLYFRCRWSTNSGGRKKESLCWIVQHFDVSKCLSLKDIYGQIKGLSYRG